jgi:hypothetical protein
MKEEYDLSLLLLLDSEHVIMKVQKWKPAIAEIEMRAWDSSLSCILENMKPINWYRLFHLTKYYTD